VDTTDPADVMNFMVYVENWLTSNEYFTKGQVEILIKNEKTRKVVAVIETKPTISDYEPYNAGFFQCCAYMARNDVPFGIFTDHKQFQFIQMDASKVLHHSDLCYLMKANYKHLDEDAPVVYGHIFEGLESLTTPTCWLAQTSLLGTAGDRPDRAPVTVEHCSAVCAPSEQWWRGLRCSVLFAH
jgi:hypothetical protein